MNTETQLGKVLGFFVSIAVGVVLIATALTTVIPWLAVLAWIIIGLKSLQILVIALHAILETK